MNALLQLISYMNIMHNASTVCVPCVIICDRIWKGYMALYVCAQDSLVAKCICMHNEVFIELWLCVS